MSTKYFSDIQKTGKYSKELCTKNALQNFKPISMFLAVQWPKSEVKVMTSLFKRIFGIFWHLVRQNKWHSNIFQLLHLHNLPSNLFAVENR